MHQARAKGARLGKAGQKFRVRVRHADIVDQHSDVEILQVGADLVVDLSVASEVNVDDARLNTELQLCKERNIKRGF